MFGAFTSFGKLGSLARAIAAAWSPADLTALAAWYDPSDLSTMFNDSAGTTPVATPGTVADSSNPVGLIQDKSGNGHHASQSTSTARPLLSARVNLLTHTNDFADATWADYEVTSTENATAAPDGTTTACKIAESSGTGQHFFYRVSTDISMPAGAPVTLSWYMKDDGVQYVMVVLSSASGYASATFDIVSGSFVRSNYIASNTYISGSAEVTPLGSGWYRVSASFMATVTETGNFSIKLNRPNFNTQDPSYAGDGVSGVYVWHPQIELGTTATTYQRVTTDSDYDGDPAKFPYYLKFDGTDDYLSTAAIDLTGTDKVTVFGGARILSDDVYAGIVEFGLQLSTDAGGFLIWARASSHGGALQAATKSWTGNVRTNDALVRPQTFVPTIQYDLAASSVADEIVIRIDGVAVATTADGATTTGVFGNLPLGIGFYNSGSYFNGNLYSLIIGGALYDAATVIEAETWVAEKTGVTL